MHRLRLALPLALCLSLVSTFAATAARAEIAVFDRDPVPEPRPPRGLAGIIVGSVGLGLAVLNLATLPVCSADFYPDQARDACRVLTFGFAGVAGTVGLIALPIGLTRNARYRDWRERNRAVASLSNLRLSVHSNRALLQYGVVF